MVAEVAVIFPEVSTVNVPLPKSIDEPSISPPSKMSAVIVPPDICVAEIVPVKLPSTPESVPVKVPPAALKSPENVPPAALKSPENVPPAASKFPLKVPVSNSTEPSDLIIQPDVP